MLQATLQRPVQQEHWAQQQLSTAPEQLWMVIQNHCHHRAAMGIVRALLSYCAAHSVMYIFSALLDTV